MKTILYDEHVKLGAKIVDFAGWQMPLQYEGIIAEHKAVRKSAGLFDVSHMGAIFIRGKRAAEFLDFLSTNRILGKPQSSVTYTVFCNETGGSVDDSLIYKLEDDHFFLVANAANREKDLLHLKKYAADYQVTIEERYEGHGIIALQGPHSCVILRELFPDIDLKPMHVDKFGDVIISRTGYTGESGYEIFASDAVILKLWQKLLSFSEVKPCGLGSRDTLRLEKGYALYGHELSESIGPLESVASWVVKEHGRQFLGKDQLRKGKRAYGLIMQDKAIPREGFSVLKEGEAIGKITSGNFSPMLNMPIALFQSSQELHPGDAVDVVIREKPYPAKISPLPFI